ncbi:MAG: nucleotide sugar dehydrogenase [Prolixibacteraceae bacterium]|nr:nucleotide sugar dehydrogenase [Prolixibacteraceae bacterium]
MKSLLSKIDSNTETIGVIGLGYVGLPLAVNFAQAGVKVIGFDKSQTKVDKINHGENYIKDIRDAVLREVVGNIKLTATTDFTRIKECDALLICVPTPLDKFRKPDMSYIESACIAIGQNMKPGTFISLESTTYPTTTEDFMLPLIEESSRQNPFNLQVSGSINDNNYNNDNHNNPTTFRHGTDFWLAYSPERVDPGNASFHTKNTPKVLGAITPEGLEIGEKIYSKAIDQLHLVSSPKVAEMVKILENTYRLVNISLINELALLSGKMGIDIWEVIEAAKTKPFGFQAFYPGPGIGGHCIPLDPFYLEHIAKKYDFDLSMIHAAGHINMRMPHYMVIKISTALNSHKKSVNGSKILFLGVAYKPNIDDARESPALEIINIIAKKGAVVSYHDPYIPSVETGHALSLQKALSLHSIELTPETLHDADCVVITTNHSAFDAEMIQQHARLIVDLRNVIKDAGKDVFKL